MLILKQIVESNVPLNFVDAKILSKRYWGKVLFSFKIRENVLYKTLMNFKQILFLSVLQSFMFLY